MNAPDRRRPTTGRNLEIVRDGDMLVMRQIGSPAKFRRIVAEVRAHLPKPKKGESIVRELAESRLRGGR